MKKGLLLFLLTLCISTQAQKVDYKYTFTLIKPAEVEGLIYEDEFIKFGYPLTRFRFDIVIKNKTDAPMKLDWNQASYVDVNGNSHKVIHNGVKFIDKEKAMPPAVIPPGANLIDLLYPADYVDYKRGGLFGTGEGEWKQQELFPRLEEGRRFVGKTIALFIPLEINGQQKFYNFVFQIGINAIPKR